MVIAQRAGGTVLLHQDHHIVMTSGFNYIVSTSMAQHIERELCRWPRSGWITFVDVCGSRIRIRASLILGLEQSSLETRELWRRWREQRRKETPPDFD
jgi:hypothetical protein